MIYIKNDLHDPYYNLAFEEYVFTNICLGETVVMLWQNRPSIIVGSFQNTWEEIDPEYVKGNGIEVVRRMTGGGAVYHDLGNVNYSYITSADSTEMDIKHFTQPVVKALRAMGLDAEQDGRNDIIVSGKKVSGNAQFARKGRVLHHGTMLFDVDMEALSSALSVKPDKYESKGVKSVKSRVGNIRYMLDEHLSINEFSKKVLEGLISSNSAKEYRLSKAELESVNALADGKYRTWEHTYGKSPEFNIRRSRRYDFGKVEALINVKDGVIAACTFYGDFFTSGCPDDISRLLVGTRYETEALRAAIGGIDTAPSLGGLCTEELQRLIAPE